MVAPDDRRGTLHVEALLECKQRGLAVTELAEFIERVAGTITMDLTNPSWLVFSDGFNVSPLRRTIKRAFDIAFALLILTLTWPLMLLTALAIRLESGHGAPILYRQERVGENGRSFAVIKYRSMRTDAERDGVARWAARNDNRVTRVGRFIRKVRLDELPQLWNVLRGDMSIIGPRPERPQFVQDLNKRIHYYALRHCVKPGLTGWAQLRYSYGSSVEDARGKAEIRPVLCKKPQFRVRLGDSGPDRGSDTVRARRTLKSMESKQVKKSPRNCVFWLIMATALLLLGGCATTPVVSGPTTTAPPVDRYIIGPGDALEIFVRDNPTLTTTVPVRPDGRVSIPLVQSIVAAGKTPDELAADLEQGIEPLHPRSAGNRNRQEFRGAYSQQVRVVGQAATPKAVPYRSGMSVLDVMIEVGGLTKFAAGNNAKIIRRLPDGTEQTIPVRLGELMNGAISHNVVMRPGDILIIPQSLFDATTSQVHGNHRGHRERA